MKPASPASAPEKPNDKTVVNFWLTPAYELASLFSPFILILYPNDVNAKIIYSVSATNATKTIPNIQNESLSKSPPVIVIVADPVGLLANTKSLLNGDFDPNIKLPI
nr:hypothetical protein [Mycoplasmopsis bovis]